MLAVTAPAGATSFVPMPIEDLTRSSVAVVVARVEAVRGVVSRDGHIDTLVDLAVEEVLHGPALGNAITLKEPGGSVDGTAEVMDGVPLYAVGEQVVAFLGTWPDGSLRTNHLALGRWTVDRDATGQLRVRQTFGRSVTLIPPPGRPMPVSMMPLADLRDAVARGRSMPSAVLPGPGPTTTPAEGHASDATNDHDVSPFVLLSPARRFFEPDEGIGITFLVDDRGDSILGLNPARQAVQDAMAEWTAVASATIVMTDGGLTADLDTGCVEGSIAAENPHRIVFDDPAGTIPPPTSCMGTLALGGGCRLDVETKVMGPTTFDRIVKGTVVFADGWTGCPLWTQCNFGEVAAHELGHAMGLEHTLDTDATMFATIHGDGRCADVRSDDASGAAFIYPTSIPPTITTLPPLPSGQTFAAYSKTLDVTGGTGPYTWSEVFNGCPGLTLGAAGVFSGTPSFSGTCGLDAKVTDADGDSHTKRFTLDMVFVVTTTTTTTLPPGACAAPADCADDDDCTVDQCNGGQCSNPLLSGIDGAQCLIDRLVPQVVCEPDVVHPKLIAFMTAKLRAADGLLGRAEGARTDTKRDKLAKRASKLLQKITAKATKFGSNGKITAECAATIGAGVAAVQQALAST